MKLRDNLDDSLIIGMITNNIIFERINDGLNLIHNSYDRKELKAADSEFQNHYNPTLIFKYMGIDGEKDLCIDLYDVFYQMCQKKKDASSLTHDIYAKWHKIMKKYFKQSSKISA